MHVHLLCHVSVKTFKLRGVNSADVVLVVPTILSSLFPVPLSIPVPDLDQLDRVSEIWVRGEVKQG